MRADPRPIPPPLTMDRPSITVDHDWLEALFLAHYAGLVRLVCGLLDDNETCEEVVQDAFASLVRLGRRPDPGREIAYLRSAALNGARSQLRRRRVRRRPLPVPPTSADAAEVAAVQRIENQRILDAIRALPRRQAEVLLLRYQAELDEAEIAATLGISPGSVKTHASRGLAAVRARLEDSP